MKYLVRKSIIRVLGGIWMPYGALCAQDVELSHSDVENARDAEGKLTRESVEHWIALHSGDFSSIKDFYASIEDDDGETVEIPWADVENEMAYLDCMFPSEEDA